MKKFERKKENYHKGRKKFVRTAKHHPMNTFTSFVKGHGIFRGGVQA